jgi:hypothetical protein
MTIISTEVAKLPVAQPDPLPANANAKEKEKDKAPAEESKEQRKAGSRNPMSLAGSADIEEVLWASIYRQKCTLQLSNPWPKTDLHLLKSRRGT